MRLSACALVSANMLRLIKTRAPRGYAAATSTGANSAKKWGKAKEVRKKFAINCKVARSGVCVRALWSQYRIVNKQCVVRRKCSMLALSLTCVY